MNNWLWLISSLNMNFTTMHWIEMCIRIQAEQSRQTRTKIHKKQTERCEERALFGRLNWTNDRELQTNRNWNNDFEDKQKHEHSTQHRHTNTKCVCVYCHTSLKPYYCFCELRIVIDRHTQCAGKRVKKNEMRKERERRKFTYNIGWNGSTFQNICSMLNFQCNAELELQQSHNLVCLLNFNTHIRTRRRRGIARLAAMGRSIRDTKRRQFDGITNEKAKNNSNNSNNIRLMSLFSLLLLAHWMQ